MEKLNGKQYGAIDPKPITHSIEMAKDSQSSNPFVKTKKVELIKNNHIHRKSRKWNVYDLIFVSFSIIVGSKWSQFWIGT